MISVALRGSREAGGMRPPSTNTLCTSGRVRSCLTIASVFSSDSLRCEPDGSSIASTERAVFCLGRKSRGSRVALQSETASSAKHRGEGGAPRHPQWRGVGLLHPPLPFLVAGVGAHEIRGEHRRDEPGG